MIAFLNLFLHVLTSPFKTPARLEAEIASLKSQAELELKQRSLHHELVTDYEQLAKTGLARKSTYIEVKREEDQKLADQRVVAVEPPDHDRREDEEGRHNGAQPCPLSYFAGKEIAGKELQA